MSKFTKNKKTILVIIGIFILVFLFWGQNILERTLDRSDGDGQRKSSTEDFRGESENVLLKTSTLEINGQRYEDNIATGTSVYDFMSKLREEGKINFTEKNYTGIGKFIDSINGVKGNGSENWIYYVNGIEAQVGVSNYKIKPGDVISWKYEKSNY